MSELLQRLNDLRNHYENIGDLNAVRLYEQLIRVNTFRPMHWDPNENWNTGMIGLSQNPLITRPNAQLPRPNAQLPRPNAQLPRPNAQLPRPNAPVQNQARPLNPTANEFKMPTRQ
jgi:hypothetical protein